MDGKESRNHQYYESNTSCLENVASVSEMLLTTECVITEIKSAKPAILSCGFSKTKIPADDQIVTSNNFTFFFRTYYKSTEIMMQSTMTWLKTRITSRLNFKARKPTLFA